MELAVTRHAYFRMEQRGITNDLLLDAFNNGVVVVVNGQYRYQHELITLVVEIAEEGYLKLVTTFPSKELNKEIKKFYRKNKKKGYGITDCQKIILESYLKPQGVIA